MSHAARTIDGSPIDVPRDAADMVPAVYDELCRLAHSRLRCEPPGHSHQPIDLVHEAYLRLLDSDHNWKSEGHFFAAAAEAMRRILVERARKKRSLKRGGGHRRIPFTDVLGATDSVEEVLVVDDVLDTFATL